MFEIIVFMLLEGLLSFFSPCILPLIPIYIGYITTNIDSSSTNKRFITFYNTLFFVLGISLVFFILGLSSSIISGYIITYKPYISFVGGIIIILFGLVNLGLFKLDIFSKSIKYQKIFNTKYQYLNAFLLGFFFSFAWTPCVGPYLSSAILAASTTNILMGNIYIFFYALGFIMPFLFVGIFTEEALKLIKNNMNILKYTVKIGAIVLIGYGLLSTYNGYIEIERIEDTKNNFNQALDFKLEDQFDNIIDLDNYQGQYVILQFVATWCKYCIESYPIMEELDKEDDISVFLVASPLVNDELDIKGIKEFYINKGYDLSVVIDDKGSHFKYYNIGAFPTLVILDLHHNIIVNQVGAIPKDNIRAFIDKLKQ